jgi:hypothetical protein
MRENQQGKTKSHTQVVRLRKVRLLITSVKHATLLDSCWEYANQNKSNSLGGRWSSVEFELLGSVSS